MSYPTKKPTHFCQLCFGMSHRRDRPRCRGCLRPYAAEAVKPAERQQHSAIAECEAH